MMQLLTDKSNFMKKITTVVISIMLLTSCSRSLLFQVKAIKNKVELESIAREVQANRIKNFPGIEQITWQTFHIKLDTLNNHFEYLHHPDFRRGTHCDFKDDVLPLSQEQFEFLNEKFNIEQITCAGNIQCKNRYVYADSLVAFVYNGKIDYLGIGKDHILVIDLKEKPRQELLQNQPAGCWPNFDFDKAYKLTDRIYYVIEKHVIFLGS